MTQCCCRFCGTELRDVFIDLGAAPLSNSYLTTERLNCAEKFYPLRAYVCRCCFLVQLEEYETPEAIFTDYAYFSSYSDSWVNHAKKYTQDMQSKFAIGTNSQVIEIASNDGYLLQHFHQQGVPVLGIEPAANVAEVAVGKGIETIVDFFGVALAQKLAVAGITADLILGNNVLAHVPAINDFIAGMKIVLKPAGIITMEFPHLLRLIEQNQFDTIYHEHFSYLSLTTVLQMLAAHGLRVFDVEELSTHGGSLRIFACHHEDGRPVATSVATLIGQEKAFGLQEIGVYQAFSAKIDKLKRDILRLLIEIINDGKTIAAYGAPAKGNTLLNYTGIRSDFIEYTVDRNPHKQGRYLPGTRIPIFAPEKIRITRPDYVVILPWNLQEEIIGQLSYIREWGGKFLLFVPAVQVI